MASMEVLDTDPLHVKKGKAKFNELMAKVTVEADAVAHADNPEDAQAVAKFLREAAESYEQNETGHGNIALNRAFEFAQQLQRKSALKLRPDGAAKTRNAGEIDNIMQAMRNCHLMTVMEVCKHYAAHGYKDKFIDR